MTRCPGCGRRWKGAHQGCIPRRASTPSATEPSPDPSLWPVIEGFSIEALVGRGGHGTVWLATTSGGENVAIKVARSDRPGAAERLEREVDALRRVGPPHVPRLVARGSAQEGARDAPFIALEYIADPTLATRLAELPGPMEQSEVQGIARSLVAAIEIVHGHGLVHRDLKPENLFLRGSSIPGVSVCVADFGLAREPGAQTASLTQTGAVVGTLEYMSPEQHQGLPNVDPRADIYALGVILFEMLTGRPPFFGPTARHDHLETRPPKPSSLAPIGAAMDEVIRTCLAKQPPGRYPSVAALREALAAAWSRDERSGSARPSNREAATSRRRATPRAMERRSMAMLHLCSDRDSAALSALVAERGCKIAAARGARYALVATDATHPVAVAIDAARTLLEADACQRVLVDFRALRCQTRRDGSVRVIEPNLLRDPRLDDPALPAGILGTETAHAMLSGIESTRVGDDLFCLSSPTKAPDGDSRHLIGRTGELTTLLEAARLAMESQVPGLATVVAEPGYGKTALAKALHRELDEIMGSQKERPRIITLSARELLGSSGDSGTLRRLFAHSLALDPSAAVAEAQRESLLARVLPNAGPTDKAVGSFVMGWSGLESEELQKLARAPRALRDAMARVVGSGLLHAARARPLAVLLDDAHWAEGVVFEALEYATRSGTKARLWVCILARPGLKQGRPSFGERAASPPVHVELRPLGKADAADLCRALLAPVQSVSAQALRMLFARTGGVPLLLCELARGLRRAGLIKRREVGDSWYLAYDELDQTPDMPLVQWLAEKELARLSPQLAMHAMLCALLGADFRDKLVVGVVDELERAGHGESFPLDTGKALEDLAHLGLLVPTGDERIGFRHALVREAMAGMMSSPLRTVAHEAALRFHERQEPTASSSDAEVERLAYRAHHAAALGAERAGPLYLELAERARARHAYPEAERLYSRALEHDREGRGRLQLTALTGRGRMRFRLERHADACRDFARAREIAAELGDREEEIEILLFAATAQDWAYEHARSKDLVDEAQRLFHGLDSPYLRAGLLMGKARSLWRAADWNAATPYLEKAISLADELGDEAYEIHIISLLILGTILPFQGDADGASRALELARELALERGDRFHEATAILNRYQMRVARGDVAGILEDARYYAAVGHEIGFMLFTFQSEANQAEALYQSGDLASARPHLAVAIELEKQRFGDTVEPNMELLEARFLLVEGDEPGARNILDKIRGTRDMVTLSPPVAVLCDLVDLGSRDSSEAEWEALIARSRSEGMDQCPIEVQDLRGRWAWRRGELEGAKQSFEAALELALEIPTLMRKRILEALDELRIEIASS